ncbi:sigma-70 family RNA polymerase sigma factor [Vibrio sp. 99-70-13A1]|uniref:sigma-70 family RNA polymerase sigma factor n=1 Tax=Vibrio sp. 99-70-13A1 TaxID=2607601 RepID=UPI001493C548|nr:sigma-70 family RNA polymerase sigma factor [Vibrio sp. 99-70-13A1]NOH95984.1 sigma-70 family RNA polymerase sigma factor [Vibrio sp. 99-70-13A1]
MENTISTTGKDKEHVIIPESQVPTELSSWLVLVANKRDKQAFTQLFKFFAPKIKRFGMTKLNNEASANELVQETMTNIWKKAHLYNEDKGAATTWVYTVMRNAAFDMLRKIKSKAEQNVADDIWPIDAALAESNEEESPFADHLMSRHIMNQIDTLPPAQRTIVKGVYFQELSQEQLAQQLDVPLGTVKSRLRLALAKLKQQMGDQRHD